MGAILTTSWTTGHLQDLITTGKAISKAPIIIGIGKGSLRMRILLEGLRVM